MTQRPRRLSMAVVTSFIVALIPVAGPAQDGFVPASPFIGLWCIGADPARQAMITRGPFGLTLRIEHGPTSTGVIAGPFDRQVIAPQWNLQHGNLNDAEDTITWSNGTFWTHCDDRIDLQGTWYLGGDRTLPCRIEQHGAKLDVRNDAGQPGSGRFTSRSTIAIVYYGVLFRGTIAAYDHRIDWDNGTYWTR